MTTARSTVLTFVAAGLMTLTTAVVLGAETSSVLTFEWTKSTPFPESRAGYAAGVIHGKLVIAGGTYWEGTKGHWTKKLFCATTHAFDPRTKTWDKLPDAPIPFGYAAYTVVNNKLFVLGGFTGSQVNRKIYILEKTADRYVWSAYGDMPADRVFAGAVSVGRTIHLLGGSTQFEPYDAAGTCCTTKTVTDSFMALDTAHPERGWRQLPPFPGPRRSLSAIETDGKSIWMFGGSFQLEQKDPITTFNEVVRYQLAEGKWETMPPLPDAAREAMPLSPFLVKDKIILVGGAKNVWQLDLKTLKYSELSPLPEAAFVDKFVWLDNMAIGAGGENSIEGPRRRSEWTFIGRVATK